MREIKFRAWNGYDLLEVEEISFSRGIYFILDDEGFEVIGNIYENKELLND